MTMGPAYRTCFLILAVLGVPMFLSYTVYSPDSGPGVSEGVLSQYREQLAALENEDYRVESIEDDNGILKINIVLKKPSAPEEVQTIAHDALRDVQKLIGEETAASVWASVYEPDGLKLGGMVYFSPNTEMYHYKSSHELQ